MPRPGWNHIIRGLRDRQPITSACIAKEDCCTLTRTVPDDLVLLAASEALSDTFKLARALGTFTATTVAEQLGISAPNANNRLKRLVAARALVRRRGVAERGGKEFLLRTRSLSVWRYVSFAAQLRAPRSGSARRTVGAVGRPTTVRYREFVRAIRRSKGAGLLRLLATASVGQWRRSPRVLVNAADPITPSGVSLVAREVLARWLLGRPGTHANRQRWTRT